MDHDATAVPMILLYNLDRSWSEIEKSEILSLVQCLVD
jgi:hypothetical protein